MAILVQAPLDDRFACESVGDRCLSGLLVDDFVDLLLFQLQATLLPGGLLLRVVVDFLVRALGTERWREACADRLDHFREPEQVQQVQCDV